MTDQRSKLHKTVYLLSKIQIIKEIPLFLEPKFFPHVKSLLSQKKTKKRKFNFRGPVLVVAGQGWILPLEKVHFLLGLWLLVCQFIEISNQMELNGQISNIEHFFLYNRVLYKFFCSKFETWPFSSI